MKNKRVTALTVTLRNLERVGDLLLPIWEIVTVARIVVHIVHWPIIPIIAPVTLSFFKKLFHKVQFLVEHSIIIFNYIDYFKGGGKNCRGPVTKDTPIIINLKSDNNSVVDNIIIFNKILKADLLEIVNVDHM